MEDRELLEMAAKAAGVGPVIAYDGRSLVIGPRSNVRLWCPLDDDGQAMRLTNSLHLCVCHTLGGLAGSPATVMTGLSLWDERAPFVFERYGTTEEAHAATRRAVVRAAAEIGKKMP